MEQMEQFYSSITIRKENVSSMQVTYYTVNMCKVVGNL